MNYKLIDSEEMLIEGDYMHRTWDVVEIPTGISIKSSLKKEEAKSLLRHLNLGGGFDGYTPTFFCETLKSN
jgi:hypothetical protein